MAEIGIGIVGGGYMGKAHSVAYAAVGAVFDTALKPRLEMIAATSPESAERYRAAYGFARGTADWQELVRDPKVEAVVIASPQSTHRAIAETAFALGKPVFCEKPLGRDVADSDAMVQAAEGHINMVGFNYIRTPASQYAYELIQSGRIGDITYFRGEHTEDFLADPDAPATWRCQGMANGCMGDLSPHMINGARRLMGPIKRLSAIVETTHPTRGGIDVTNDAKPVHLNHGGNRRTGLHPFTKLRDPRFDKAGRWGNDLAASQLEIGDFQFASLGDHLNFGDLLLHLGQLDAQCGSFGFQSLLLHLPIGKCTFLMKLDVGL